MSITHDEDTRRSQLSGYGRDGNPMPTEYQILCKMAELWLEYFPASQFQDEGYLKDVMEDAEEQKQDAEDVKKTENSLKGNL